MKRENRELELYIHIPFCARKCEYCDFLSAPRPRAVQSAYVDALCREIAAAPEREGDYRISTVYIGGGTPSLLAGEEIGRILAACRENFRFLPDAEISIEANPGTVDAPKLEAYLRAGVNRISFGCQSADDAELAALGRIHTWADFTASYRLARSAGFANINVDLMSGLPGQTAAGWERTLRRAAALAPEHLSAYSLIIEEGTPFAERRLDLPDEDTEREMYGRTAVILAEYGYRQYEISNYARPGFYCRHNVGYWKRAEYLGLGLGSASLVGEKRFSCCRDLDRYLEAEGRPERIRGTAETIPVEEQKEEYMILGLRMTDGVSCAEYRRAFGEDLMEKYGETVRKYEAMGLMRRADGRVALTVPGISVSNTILVDFME